MNLCTVCNKPLPRGRQTKCSDECAKAGKAAYHIARKDRRRRSQQLAIVPCALAQAWVGVRIEQEQA